MHGRPVATLFGIDAAGKVLYLNSFAKSLGSAFRIAYLVLPESLAQRFNAELGFYSNTVSPLDQLALASFIEEGHYERHVNRLRTHARRSQEALVEALRKGPLAHRLRFEGLVFFTTTKFRISRLISFGFHRFAKVPHPFFANCPIFPSSRLPRTFCSARRTQPADHDA